MFLYNILFISKSKSQHNSQRVTPRNRTKVIRKLGKGVTSPELNGSRLSRLLVSMNCKTVEAEVGRWGVGRWGGGRWAHQRLWVAACPPESAVAVPMHLQLGTWHAAAVVQWGELSDKMDVSQTSSGCKRPRSAYPLTLFWLAILT